MEKAVKNLFLVVITALIAAVLCAAVYGALWLGYILGFTM